MPSAVIARLAVVEDDDIVVNPIKSLKAIGGVSGTSPHRVLGEDDIVPRRS